MPADSSTPPTVLDRRTVLKTFGAGLVGTALATGTAGADTSAQLRVVGHSLLGNPAGGEAEGDVSPDEDLAAVGSFFTDNGTYIVDLADASEPTRIGHVPLEDTRNADVKFHPDGDHVFRSNEPNNDDGRGGFDVLDVSDPHDPRELAHYDQDLSHGVHNVTPFGDDYLLLSGTGRGMVVMDVSDLSTPMEVAAYQVGDHSVHDVTVRGDLAFVAHWNAGLRVVDLSDPANPDEVAAFDYHDKEYTNAHFARPHPEEDYVVLGDEIYAGSPGPKHVIAFDTSANWTEELAVFSFPQGNAQQPTGNQGYWWTGHNFDFGAASRGEQDHLYSGDYKAGVQAFDLSDPSDPQHLDQYLPTRGINEVKREDAGGFIDAVPFTWGAKVGESGLVYATDFQTGLYVLELT